MVVHEKILTELEKNSHRQLKLAVNQSESDIILAGCA